MSPIIVRSTIGLGFTILVAAVLGFLGMGATPPDPDWGPLISQSRIHLPKARWYPMFPGLAILLTAARLIYGGLGSDTAGSVRIPPPPATLSGSSQR